MFITMAYAADTPTGGGAIFELLFPLILVFGIIYFMIIRPQQKRQRQHTAMIEAISRNDVVVTQGGLIGKVVRIGDDELDIEVGSAKLTIVRSMVLTVRNKDEKK